MSKDEENQRTCIFCGEPADSREHLLPRWLAEVLPSEEKVIHTRLGEGGAEQRWERRPFEERTKQVCAACNGGWMCKVEEAAKPILAPMLSRSQMPLELDRREQWLAALWAAKTAFVLASQLPEQLVPTEQRLLLKLNWKPNTQVSIWIGSHARAREDPINSVYVIKPLSAEMAGGSGQQVDFGYMAFIAIGGLSFFLVGHRYSGRLGFKLNPPASELLSKLWPSRSEALLWPPPLMMDRELIDVVLDQGVVPPQLEMEVGEAPWELEE